ncbi:MAG: SAM-dependent methyltransferase [Micavibrio sp.]|nr:SAM-dependent methyltransferase [Micavibrio sp.]
MPEKKPPLPKPREPLTTAGEALAEMILQNGPVSVATFMEVAGSHYYAAKDAFGVDGDFITAPEISQMFGEMLGAWVVDAWMQMGKPDRAQLLELGPGRGTLAADIMRTISAWPDCKAAFSLHLVETSPLLRQKQAELLIKHQPTWYERLEDVPGGLCFVIANEFLDALPIRQFEKTGGIWQERGIGFDAASGSFYFTPCAATAPVIVPPEFRNEPDGSIFEVSDASIHIMLDVAKRVAEYGGAALLVDYGHAARGIGDTLQTLHKHTFTQVLGQPGRDDITAHVDFVACAEAVADKVTVHGPVMQGEFLRGLGITQRAEALGAPATDDQRKDINAALHRLVSPTAMGRLFKVLGLTAKESNIKPAGFNESDGHEVSDDGP